MSCRAKLGICAFGRHYYDLDSVKMRKCIVPYIIWVKEHREEILKLAETPDTSFAVDGRRFYFSLVELDDEESCFCVDLDRNQWRESGNSPFYMDWAEVWEFCHYAKNCYTIFWEQVPTWDTYRATRYVA